jgi:hypothetical protein
MGIKKIGGGTKYCVSSDFDEFAEMLHVTVDFDSGSFWNKHVARAGQKTSQMAAGREKLKQLDDLEDYDEIEAVLEMQSGGVASAAPKSTIVRLKKVPADDAIFRFAKALAQSYFDEQKTWKLNQFKKELPYEVTFEIPGSVVSFDSGNKTTHRSMVIGAKLVANQWPRLAFGNVHCGGPGKA